MAESCSISWLTRRKVPRNKNVIRVATSTALPAKRLKEARRDAAFDWTPSTDLRKGDTYLVEAGEVMPADGTGGTKVLSDWLVVRVTVNPGEAFLDRMITMVESARRQKTPNEIALWILLVKLTLGEPGVNVLELNLALDAGQ